MELAGRIGNDFRYWSPQNFMEFVAQVFRLPENLDTIRTIAQQGPLDGDFIGELAREPEDALLLPIPPEDYKTLRDSALVIVNRHEEAQAQLRGLEAAMRILEDMQEQQAERERPPDLVEREDEEPEERRDARRDDEPLNIIEFMREAARARRNMGEGEDDEPAHQALTEDDLREFQRRMDAAMNQTMRDGRAIERLLRRMEQAKRMIDSGREPADGSVRDVAWATAEINRLEDERRLRIERENRDKEEITANINRMKADLRHMENEERERPRRVIRAVHIAPPPDPIMPFRRKVEVSKHQFRLICFAHRRIDQDVRESVELLKQMRRVLVHRPPRVENQDAPQAPPVVDQRPDVRLGRVARPRRVPRPRERRQQNQGARPVVNGRRPPRPPRHGRDGLIARPRRRLANQNNV